MNILTDSLRFMVHKKRIKLHGYVLMKNYIHMIASGMNVTREIGMFKSYTAKNIICTLQRSMDHIRVLKQLHYARKEYRKDRFYQVWQEGMHPLKIRDSNMAYRVLHYIHNNPVKSGDVEAPEEWLYSSCRDYQDGRGPVPVELLLQDACM